MMGRCSSLALLLGACLTALLAGMCSGADNLAAYPVAWATVPAAPNPNVSVQAGCACNLLGGACTPNCCCDPDCPAAVVAAYNASGTCLPAGPPSDQLDYCIPGDTFATVNLPSGSYYTVEKAVAGQDFMTQLLCIVNDNNPSLGSTYPDPEAGDVGSNAAQAACAVPAVSSRAAPASYSVGVPVVAAVGTQWSNFSVPLPALSAECTVGLPLGFMARVPTNLADTSSNCERTIPAAAIAATCASASSPLSPTRYTGTTFPATPTSTADPLAPTVTITSVNPSTGALAAVAAAAAAPTWNASASACAGAVLGAAYTFTYSMAASGQAQLTAVALDLTVGTVSAASPGQPLVVQQAFSVQWAPQGADAAALQAYSGNPGYLPGFPVLAGTLVDNAVSGSTRSAVARWQDGLPLPAAASDGTCSPAAPPTPVSFGFNASSSCLASYSQAQLAAFCAGGSNAAVAAALGGLLADLVAGDVRVGVWGNSAYNNTADWVPVVPSGYSAAAVMAWSAATATCSNVLTGFDITLLTGQAYSTNNLQSKVLFARVCFRYGSWTFDGSRDAAAPQRFPLTFTAGFAPSNQSAAVPARKPPPPLVMPLNPDLFYPFLVGNAAGDSTRPGVLSVLTALGAAAGMLLLL